MNTNQQQLQRYLEDWLHKGFKKFSSAQQKSTCGLRPLSGQRKLTPAERAIVNHLFPLSNAHRKNIKLLARSLSLAFRLPFSVHQSERQQIFVAGSALGKYRLGQDILLGGKAKIERPKLYLEVGPLHDDSMDELLPWLPGGHKQWFLTEILLPLLSSNEAFKLSIRFKNTVQLLSGDATAAFLDQNIQLA